MCDTYNRFEVQHRYGEALPGMQSKVQGWPKYRCGGTGVSASASIQVVANKRGLGTRMFHKQVRRLMVQRRQKIHS